MSNRMTLLALAFAFAFVGWPAAENASAQAPVAVAAYYAPQPVVAYRPVRFGLFGRRIVYRPRFAFAAPVAVAPVVAAPVQAYYAPAVPTSVYFGRRQAIGYSTYYSPIPTPTYWRP